MSECVECERTNRKIYELEYAYYCGECLVEYATKLEKDVKKARYELECQITYEMNVGQEQWASEKKAVAECAAAKTDAYDCRLEIDRLKKKLGEME